MKYIILATVLLACSIASASPPAKPEGSVILRPPVLICGSMAALLNAHIDMGDGTVDNKHPKCTVTNKAIPVIPLGRKGNVIRFYIPRSDISVYALTNEVI